MNRLPRQPTAWTRRRWMTSVTAVFALHVAFVFALSHSRQAPQMAAATPTVFRLIPPGAQTAEAQVYLAPDPTLFLLPNSNSFSGSAWLNPAQRGHLVADWTEPPQWLGLDAEALGGSFREYVRATPPGPFAVADKPPLRLGALRLFVPEETLVHESRLILDAAIEARPAGPLPALPAWSHSEPLSPSVVQIGVGETGEVMFAALLRRSGLAAADQHALQVARTLQFEPRRTASGTSGEAVVWGELTFEWHTTAPPPAETASANP